MRALRQLPAHPSRSDITSAVRLGITEEGRRESAETKAKIDDVVSIIMGEFSVTSSSSDRSSMLDVAVQKAHEYGLGRELDVELMKVIGYIADKGEPRFAIEIGKKFHQNMDMVHEIVAASVMREPLQRLNSPDLAESKARDAGIRFGVIREIGRREVEARINSRNGPLGLSELVNITEIAIRLRLKPKHLRVFKPAVMEGVRELCKSAKADNMSGDIGHICTTFNITGPEIMILVHEANVSTLGTQARSEIRPFSDPGPRDPGLDVPRH